LEAQKARNLSLLSTISPIENFGMKRFKFGARNNLNSMKRKNTKYSFILTMNSEIAKNKKKT
jgi:hypothetical protein